MPTPPDLAVLEKFVVALQHQQVVKYFDVLSGVLLIYDYLLNLDREIRYIWSSRWSIVKMLYILQRYLPFMDTVALVFHHDFSFGLSTRVCAIEYHISGWSFIIGIVISEVILAFRLWAVWGKGMPVTTGICAYLLACWVPCFVLFTTFLNSMEFAIAPFPGFPGCFISGGRSHTLSICWVLMMVYDTGSLVLMLIPGVKSYREGGSSDLVKTVFRDGVIYYALIFIVSVVNVIVINVLPEDMVHLLSSFERALHSILTSRAVLDIRHVVHVDYVHRDYES